VSDEDVRGPFGCTERRPIDLVEPTTGLLSIDAARVLDVSHRLARRFAAVALVALVLLIVVPFVGLSVLALTSPYETVVVSPECAQTITIPTDRTVAIGGHGSGVVAEAGDRAVAIEISSNPSPRPVAAYLLDRSTSQILWQTSLASDAVVAGIDGGVLFLWDDKIGYAVSAATGNPLGAVVRSDNYRGIFTSGGDRRLQIDAEVTSIGLGGAPFSYHAFHVAGVVDGCAFGLPDG
jgi:hypothetical protein